MALISRLEPDVSIPLLPQNPPMSRFAKMDRHVGMSLQMRNQEVISEQYRPPVLVGLTPTCPYGLGPCWE